MVRWCWKPARADTAPPPRSFITAMEEGAGINWTLILSFGVALPDACLSPPSSSSHSMASPFSLSHWSLGVCLDTVVVLSPHLHLSSMHPSIFFSSRVHHLLTLFVFPPSSLALTCWLHLSPIFFFLLLHLLLVLAYRNRKRESERARLTQWRSTTFQVGPFRRYSQCQWTECRVAQRSSQAAFSFLFFFFFWSCKWNTLRRTPSDSEWVLGNKAWACLDSNVFLLATIPYWNECFKNDLEIRHHWLDCMRHRVVDADHVCKKVTSFSGLGDGLLSRFNLCRLQGMLGIRAHLLSLAAKPLAMCVGKAIYHSSSILFTSLSP